MAKRKTKYVYVIMFQGIVEKVVDKPSKVKSFKRKFGSKDVEVHKRPIE